MLRYLQNEPIFSNAIRHRRLIELAAELSPNIPNFSAAARICPKAISFICRKRIWRLFIAEFQRDLATEADDIDPMCSIERLPAGS